MGNISALVKEAHDIAERLYKKERGQPFNRYADIFAWLGRMAKQQKPLALVVEALRACEREDKDNHISFPIEYLGGTLRKMEAEEQSKTLRQSGASMADLMAPLLQKKSSSSSGRGSR